jgi:hypothetical protein
MSLFDPAALLDQTLESNATRRDPLPVGEAVAQITGLDLKSGTSQKGNDWTRLDVKLEITDPEYLAQIPGQPEKAFANLGIMLDMQNGSIATGPNRNIRLGRLREACGTNGKPLSAMVGNFLRISITHKPHPTDPEIVLDEVSAYTKA